MKTLILTILLTSSVSLAGDLCTDGIVYDNPYVYGGTPQSSCNEPGLAPLTTAQQVTGSAKYGICDYAVLMRIATKDAAKKCGQPIEYITQISEWRFECFDNTFASDLGAKASADFQCL